MSTSTSTPFASRTGRKAGLVAALGAVASVALTTAPATASTTAQAAPASMSVSTSASTSAPGTVNTSGAPLTVRSGPSTSYGSVGSVADGTRLTIACQTYGSTVSGTYGTSKIWDKLSTGGYVADAYVYTGTDGLAAALCGSSTGTTNPLLDYADNYIGRYAKYACSDAGFGRLSHYQCKQFVSCAVSKAYGRNIAGGYYSPYVNQGFREVSKADARAGDVVQLNRASSRDSFYSGMHTAVLASSFGGDNGAIVVDSNFGGDTRGYELVRKHEWDPYAQASRYGLEVNIFRYTR